jgi:hypothetical protein
MTSQVHLGARYAASCVMWRCAVILSAEGAKDLSHLVSLKKLRYHPVLHVSAYRALHPPVIRSQHERSPSFCHCVGLFVGSAFRRRCGTVVSTTPAHASGNAEPGADRRRLGAVGCGGRGVCVEEIEEESGIGNRESGIGNRESGIRALSNEHTSFLFCDSGAHAHADGGDGADHRHR